MNSIPSDYEGVGLIVIKRLHRMVRHGFRPWLGYSGECCEDQDIHLRRRRREGKAWTEDVASILADGSVWFVLEVTLKYPRKDFDGKFYSKASAIFAGDTENFEALFPLDCHPSTRGRFTRWLYEHGY